MSLTTKGRVKSREMEKKKKAANITNIGQKSSFRAHPWLTVYREALGAASLLIYLFFFMSKGKKLENSKEKEKKKKTKITTIPPLGISSAILLCILKAFFKNSSCKIIFKYVHVFYYLNVKWLAHPSINGILIYLNHKNNTSKFVTGNEQFESKNIWVQILSPSFTT